jgi:ferredoxin
VGEDDVYRELQKHLDQMPVGFPATKSGVELRVLKFIFTPEEAKIATKLSWIPEPLETIYSRFDKSEISIKELKKKLDTMLKKGGVHYRKVKGEKHYANPFLMVGMYEYQIKRETKEFMEDVAQYNSEAWAMEFLTTARHQFRVVPIEQSITPELHVETYDDLRKTIESMDGPFIVLDCVCRKLMDLRGQPCKVTDLRENCIALDEDACELFRDQGWGRSVSKEELLEILRKNEEAGLVLEPGNAIRPHFVCSCCGDCCGILTGLKMLPRPVDFFHTNYYAQVDPELCDGCETCIERCQMGARKMVEGVSTVDLDRCIGCGNCVVTCPSEATILKRKEEVHVPPKTSDDLAIKIKSIKDQVTQTSVKG